jgi:ABC-type transport system involved in multi-copper enzyme maturation permease subunit
VRRRNLLDADRPMWWKERMSQRTLGRLGWGGRIATVLLYGGAWFWLGIAVITSLAIDRHDDFHSWLSPIMFFAVGGVPTFGCFAMLLAAARGAGSITAEREQDTWITLVSTPLGGDEIVRAKMLGAAFSVRYWYVIMAVTWGFCVVVHPSFIGWVPILALVYALGLWFSAAVGVYFSLRYETSIKAMGAALTTLVLGTGIGPILVGAIFQAESPTAFSLPVVVAMPHIAAMEMAGLSNPGGDFYGYLTLVIIALFGYVIATVLLTVACMRRFDELAGRTIVQGRGVVTPAGE